jgi:hypothetical protein
MSATDSQPGEVPGRHNDLTDVAGVRVGHHHRRGSGWLTGTTVVAPAAASGLVAGADVRGSAPGTRQLDLLAPVSRVERVHAVLQGQPPPFTHRPPNNPPLCPSPAPSTSTRDAARLAARVAQTTRSDR